jgi:rhodanese-related sulfurtransferase
MRRLARIALVLGALGAASPASGDHTRFGPVLTIDPASARMLLERGGVAPIDLRPEGDFATGHLPGAQSWPLPTVEARLRALPHGGVIILYGEGPIERVLRAYHLIRSRVAGDVYVLEGGLEGWRRAGYTLER